MRTIGWLLLKYNNTALGDLYHSNGSQTLKIIAYFIKEANLTKEYGCNKFDIYMKIDIFFYSVVGQNFSCFLW